MPTDTAPTRRSEARQRTWRELKAAALEEVRDEGPAGLKLRSVARRLGMSPAGLYRYVDSRDGLLTALIADGYHDLADHLEVALGTDPDALSPRDRPVPAVPVIAGPDHDHLERLVAVGRAYRAWSVGHPNEFGLLFGDPIPGYEAPEAGATLEAMGRVGAALARPIVEAADDGRLRVDPELADPALHGPPGALDVLLPDGVDRGVGPLLLLAWGRLHGQVSLEVFGHHRWLFPDGCEALVVADIHRTARDLGLVASEVPA